MKKRIIALVIAAIFGYSFSTTVVAAEDNAELTSECAPQDSSTEDTEDIENSEEPETEPEAESATETITVEESETSCTHICHINISYTKEYYVMENLCPTGDIDTMNLESIFSVEEGHSLDETLTNVASEIKDIVSSVDELSGCIEKSYSVNAFISIDGKVKIENVESFEPEEIECEVTVYKEAEIESEKLTPDEELESEELDEPSETESTEEVEHESDEETEASQSEKSEESHESKDFDESENDSSENEKPGDDIPSDIKPENEDVTEETPDSIN